MRIGFSIMAGLALAVCGSMAIAGSGYTPPAAGSGVSGDGTGVTDASAFRSALSLGTAATVNTGTSNGNAVVLGMGATLPAVNASNLTGISSSQVSGLGTAAGYSAMSFLQAVNNLSDVTPSTARTNLGLGDSATSDLVGSTEFVVCPSGCPYSTVSSAITAAAAVASSGNERVVHVLPATYSENVTLARFVQLVGVGGTDRGTPIISGTVTVNFGACAIGLYQCTTTIRGMQISAPAAAYAIDFTGSGPQSLHLDRVFVYLGSSGKGIRVNNSGSETGVTSVVYMNDLSTIDAGTNSNAHLEHSAGRVRWAGHNVLQDATYGTAITISGSAVEWQVGGALYVEGSMTSASSGAMTLAMAAFQVASGSCITQNGAGLMMLGSIACASSANASAAVAGAGLLAYTPAMFAAPGYTSTLLASTLNGGAGPVAVASPIGTAALANTGTSAGNVPVLDGSAKLPAINGSNLTGLVSSQVSGLGTAATKNTGTSSGNVPVLGASGLPAVGGSLLTGLTSSQISGLGTAAASATGDFVAASAGYAADTWTYTWTPADGDPISANGWTAVQSAATASTTVDGVACYSITPSGASGESSIYKNVGAASASSWEARILLWAPNGNTSRFGWTFDSGIGTTDALFKVTMGGTTTPLRMNEAVVTVPALQYTTRWVMWTLRCYYGLSTTQTCELYSGRIKLYTFESATAEAAVSAGRFTIGRTTGAIVTAGCIGGIWVRSNGVNEAPVEYRERARSF